MMNILKKYREVFFERVDTMKARIKELDMAIIFNDKQKIWKDRLQRGQMIVERISLTSELRRMIG